MYQSGEEAGLREETGVSLVRSQVSVWRGGRSESGELAGLSFGRR